MQALRGSAMDTSNMKKYVVTDLVGKFRLTKTGTSPNGEDDLVLYPGDELLYHRGTIVLGNEVYKRPIENLVKDGWIALADDEETDEMMDRIVNKSHVNNRLAPNARIEYQTQEPAKASNGVDMMGGVEVLPDNWDKLPWSNKRAYVLNMTDIGLLEDLLDVEDEPPVLKALNKRIEELKSGDVVVPKAKQAKAPAKTDKATQAALRSGKNVGSNFKKHEPIKMRKADEQALMDNFNPAVLAVEEQEIMPTNFDKAASPVKVPKKMGRPPKANNNNGDKFNAVVEEQNFYDDGTSFEGSEISFDD